MIDKINEYSTTSYYGQELKNYIEEQKNVVNERIEKGQEGPSIQIGNKSMTKQEWDKLMKKVDYVIQENQERLEREEEKKLEKEAEDKIKEEKFQEDKLLEKSESDKLMTKRWQAELDKEKQK